MSKKRPYKEWPSKLSPATELRHKGTQYWAKKQVRPHKPAPLPEEQLSGPGVRQGPRMPAAYYLEGLETPTHGKSPSTRKYR